jgi:hypothetical protein
VVLSGAAASLGSAAAALACSHLENGHAARPMNAVTHIFDGGEPLPHNGTWSRNTALGFAIHTGASIFWATFFEGLLGRQARQGSGEALACGAAIAAAAYVVDYQVVGERFRPGFERYLSRRSMFAVYAALAAGFAVAALLTARRTAPRAVPRPRARRKAGAPE